MNAMTTLRTGRFGRGGSSAQSREPMTLDQIRNVAPSVFAESRHSSRTQRFTYIPTSQIVEHLISRDFGVFSVMQGGSRDDEKRGFTKHLVRFRRRRGACPRRARPSVRSTGRPYTE